MKFVSHAVSHNVVQDRHAEVTDTNAPKTIPFEPFCMYQRSDAIDQTEGCSRRLGGSSRNYALRMRGSCFVSIVLNSKLLHASCSNCRYAVGQMLLGLFKFYSNDAMLWPCVCLSVCPPQIDVVSKRLNRSGWCWLGFRSILHSVGREFGYIQE